MAKKSTYETRQGESSVCVCVCALSKVLIEENLYEKPKLQA